MSAERKSWELGDFMQRDLPPVEYIIRPWLPTKGLAMLAGYRGTCKTWSALTIGLAVASGARYSQWQAPKPRGILYVDGEMDARELRNDRIAPMLEAMAPECRERAMQNFRVLSHEAFEHGIPRLSDPLSGGQRLVEREAAGGELIILDNLSCLTAGAENDADAWQGMQDWLLKLRRAGKTVLFLHHGGKPQKDGNTKQRGSSRREDVLNTSVMLLRRPGMPRDEFQWKWEKTRGFTPDAESYHLRIGRQGWPEVVETDDTETAQREMAALLHSQGFSLRDIGERVGVGKDTVRKWLAEAAAPRGGEPLN